MIIMLVMLAVCYLTANCLLEHLVIITWNVRIVHSDTVHGYVSVASNFQFCNEPIQWATCNAMDALQRQCVQRSTPE